MGVVRNLIVADSEFGGNGLAAAIAMSNYGTIENCLVETTVSVKGVLT
jgi:hypothetical protein